MNGVGGVEMKWQTLTQQIDNAICMKVREGIYVTLVYRTWEISGWSHWKMIPIDKTPATFIPGVDPLRIGRSN